MLNEKNINHVYLAIGRTDLRKSINGLSILVQESFELDPFSNSIFVFCNKKKDKIKLLKWDNNGFWLYYKRLEKDKFKWPKSSNSKVVEIKERNLRWLLEGLNFTQNSAHKEISERQIF